jgi:hypothetical protein
MEGQAAACFGSPARRSRRRSESAAKGRNEQANQERHARFGRYVPLDGCIRVPPHSAADGRYVSRHGDIFVQVNRSKDSDSVALHIAVNRGSSGDDYQVTAGAFHMDGTADAHHVTDFLVLRHGDAPANLNNVPSLANKAELTSSGKNRTQTENSRREDCTA